MARFSVSKGTQYTFQNSEYELKRQTALGWQTENIVTGILESISQDDFHEKWKSGAIQIKIKSGDIAKFKGEFGLKTVYLEDVAPDQKETMLNKRMLVENYLREFDGRLSKMSAAKFLKNLSNWPAQLGKIVHADTFLRWTRRYRETGRNAFCFLKLNHKKGNRERRIDVAVEELCVKAINEKYMIENFSTQAKVLEYVKELIDQENALRNVEYALEHPSISVIRRLIGEISQLDKDIARFGKEYASHVHRESIGTIETRRPLYRAEVDHTRLNIFIVDEETGLVIGRPWLTLIIDTDSRCILGYYLSFDPPSHSSVAKALRHAIMPKTGAEFKEKYPHVKNKYVMHGIMKFLTCDNGLEFHSDALSASCLILAIILAFMPRKKPWWKATVERVLGTGNRAVTNDLEGRTLASVAERKNYKSNKEAIYTLTEVDGLIMKWIVDEYHQKRHRSLGMSPARYWEMYAPDIIDLPKEPTHLDSVLGQITRNKPIHHYGIELNGIVYNNHELMEIKQFHAKKVRLDVRWNTDEMGWIFVCVPGGGVLKVQANNAFIDYATGITHYQHKLYTKFYDDMHKEPNKTYADGLRIAKEAVRAAAKKRFAKGNNSTRLAAKRALQSESLAQKPAEIVTPSTPVDVVVPGELTVATKPRPSLTAIHSNRTF